MREELRSKLVSSFPDLFKSGRIKDVEAGFNPLFPGPNTVSFWIETGDGWYDLLYELCTRIQEIIDDKGDEEFREYFRILQVKEKFGGLRFYMSGAPKLIHDLVDEYEEKSYKTCELCGEPGQMMSCNVGKGGWYQTLCTKCGVDKEYGPPIPRRR